MTDGNALFFLRIDFNPLVDERTGYDYEQNEQHENDTRGRKNASYSGHGDSSFYEGIFRMRISLYDVVSRLRFQAFPHSAYSIILWEAHARLDICPDE